MGLSVSVSSHQILPADTPAYLSRG
jgi:hypothetical protein